MKKVLTKIKVQLGSLKKLFQANMMQFGYSKQFFGRALFLIWLILCIFIFIIFPGKVSYVQRSDLGEWYLLPGKLARIDPASDLAKLLESFVGVVVFSVACTSLGIFIAKKIKIDIDNISNSRIGFTSVALLATEFLIGHGLFSLIFLTLGGLYELTPLYVILVLSAGFLLGFRFIKNDFLNAFMDVKSNCKKSLEWRWGNGILWLSMGVLSVSLLYSTARISYDSSSIYFSNAKLTAMARHVQFFLDNTFVVSAFQTAIQYTALIQIFGDQSARMFSWIFGIIVIIFSLALAGKLGISNQAKPILLALLLTSTAFLDLMGDGKVDLMSSAPAIAGVYWMVVESDGKEPNKSLLLIIGLMAGLAIVARPFNAFLLGIFVLLFYIQRLYIKNGFEPINYRRFAISMFWIGIGALGLGIYHLFANWMILDDPLDFLFNYLRLAKSDPATDPWDYQPDQFLAIRLLYPLVATFRNTPASLGNISPLFIAFFPALFIQDIRKAVKFSKQQYILCIISIITLLIWLFSLFTVSEIRYVLFVWAILFIPLAEIIATTLKNDDRFFQDIVGALIITLLVFTILRTVYISLDAYSPIDAQGNPQCFCPSLTPINEAASPGDRVLTLTASRYYLRSDLFACSTKHDEYSRLRTAAKKDSESFWLEVYQQGYKYIIYENEYATRHLHMGIIPSQDNAPEWLELERIYGKSGDLNFVYRTSFRNPPSGKPVICKMNTSGIWEVHSQ